MKNNIITLTDSYKQTHGPMYDPKTEGVYSYFESRDGARFSYTVFFGLQYFLKEYLTGVVVTQEGIEQAASLCEKHFGNPDIFNREMWEYILKEHGGRLPVRIKAVPEGMVIPVSNVLMTVENTDPKCYPLTNHLETVLSQVWYPSTVATLSRKVKERISSFLDTTASTDAGLPFMLHDFGFRGVSSVESAGIGGVAHLVNFQGTDTMRAIEFAMEYYNSDVCAYSVYATEHSVMTSYGAKDEVKIFERLLREYPKGILSIVSDSYDIFNACDQILGVQLKELVLARDGVLVVRPDSGDPVATVLRVLKILGNRFGTTMNDKGYVVLNPKVRVLWGDGLDYDAIYDILLAMKGNGWSAENIATFGMGGGLLQRVNRDTQRFAFKCSPQLREGIWLNISKDPVDKTKISKAGKLALLEAEGRYNTVVAFQDEPGDILQTVFEDGELLVDWTFDQVRENAKL